MLTNSKPYIGTLKPLINIDHLSQQDWAATYWNKMGVPKSKLNIGMALYGRSFTLKDRNNYNVGAEASGKGRAGKFTREAGFLSYYEVTFK